MSTPTKVSKSAALYERALKVLAGGVSRNTVLRDPHPLYADFGAGSQLTDIEGVTRIDFANNMASLIHGHADPDVVKAVTEQLGKGSAFTMATEVEVDYAELLCGRNPGFEKIRFVNSGTEALDGDAQSFAGVHRQGQDRQGRRCLSWRVRLRRGEPSAESRNLGRHRSSQERTPRPWHAGVRAQRCGHHPVQ